MKKIPKHRPKPQKTRRIDPDEPLPVFMALTIPEVAGLFGVAHITVQKWIENGCPKNEEEKKTHGRSAQTLNLYRVIQWRIKDTAEAARKARKEEIANETAQLKLDERKGLLVPRSEMVDILASRALSLRNFFERGLALSRPLRANRTVEELVSLDYELFKALTEAYCGVR